MPYAVKILDSAFITPDVKRFKVEKPKGYTFIPGQAAGVALDKPGWADRKKPFTFTSLTSSRTLEFIIKIYDDHDGVTKQLGLAKKSDGLLLGDPYGAIHYQGPGFFFAAGAGVTPYIAILRDLQKKKKLAGNTLVCSNKTADDVIMDKEFTEMLGKNFLNIFTRQHVIGFREKRIDRDTLVALVQDFNQHFYVCGPQAFVTDLCDMLKTLGADPGSLVIEQ
ncbi:MAG: flavodoxin reductase [Flavobacteriales bacterium]|nr:flavodoxin reductase [Flavobacteriales bacterium]